MTTKKTKKKDKIKIGNLNDLQNELLKLQYITTLLDNKSLINKVKDIFNLDDNILMYLTENLNNEKVIYKSNNIYEFFDYIKSIMIHEKYYTELCTILIKINKLKISRVEYDRVQTIQDNVDDILKEIDILKEKTSFRIDEQNSLKINKLESDISNDYIYTKDIELLKKVIINHNIKEEYDENTNVKSLFIHIPKELNKEYIKAQKGSIEYYHHINNNIPRMKRLIKNINKYINPIDIEKSFFEINQSDTLQDSINIAIASFNNKEFKSISGSNDIKGYCKSPPYNEQYFKSNKVNKLGKLGIGYNRINDSEKKIFEEIHKQIEFKNLPDEGKLTLYSKWEPCPSCYYVICQFSKLHPNIDVRVEYIKKYGEQ